MGAGAALCSRKPPGLLTRLHAKVWHNIQHKEPAITTSTATCTDKTEAIHTKARQEPPRCMTKPRQQLLHRMGRVCCRACSTSGHGSALALQSCHMHAEEYAVQAARCSDHSSQAIALLGVRIGLNDYADVTEQQRSLQRGVTDSTTLT